MFEQYYGKAKELLLPKEECRLFPSIDDRAVWENLHPEQKEFYLREAEKHLDYDWPALPAVRYADFVRNGNRSRFTALESKRRAVLLCLCVAECIENKGRFLDDIINGIWVICEETTWVGPAHISAIPGLDKSEWRALPPWDGEMAMYIDHFAGDTACLLAGLLTFLAPRLEEVMPQVAQRLQYELMRRIVLPFVNRDDFWWMGSDEKPDVNNWAPWCAGNSLAVAAMVCEDDALRATALEKFMRIEDRYLHGLPEDGSCDEGARYWSIACNAVFNGLDVADKMTGGKVNLYTNEVLRRYAHFGVNQHIYKSQFTLYADNDRILRPGVMGLWNIAHRVRDGELARLAVHMRAKDYETQVRESQLIAGCMHQHAYVALQMLLTYPKYAAESDTGAPLLRDTWQPGIRTMTARQKEGTPEGLFLTARGGHNGESHNHNDIGSFQLYSDGCPAVIDLGTAVYTSNTFGKDRYTANPQFTSAWHSIPSAGGVLQGAGEKYASANEVYTCGETVTTLALNGEGTFPAETPFSVWKRTFTFNRSEEAVTVADEFELKTPAPVEVVLMTAEKPAAAGNTLHIPAEDGRAVLAQFTEGWTVETQRLDLSWDLRYREFWNGEAWRTVLKKDCSGKDTFTVKFKQESAEK